MNVFLTQTIAGVDRLFGLDLQLLVDLAIELVAVFVLFTAFSNLLFNPARDFLRKRQEKIKGEMEYATKEKEDAINLKAEYTAKLNDVQKETEAILSETRKKALKKENEIVDNAKAEAARIIERANKEVELEKNKVKDEVKQEMISVASLMAGKFVAASMSEKQQAQLIKDTLKEMGDKTWQN